MAPIMPPAGSLRLDRDQAGGAREMPACERDTGRESGLQTIADQGAGGAGGGRHPLSEGTRRRPLARLSWLLSASAVLCFAAGYQLAVWLGDASHAGSPPSMMRLAQPRQVEEFTLRDQHGNEYHRSHLFGRWTFVVFGYSRCPDVCPMTLEVLAQVLDLLSPAPPSEQAPAAVLVSVDPAHDTPQVLGRYVIRFDERILALGGDPAEVARLARSIGVHYAGDARDALGRTLVDHTALIALVDPRAHLTAGFALPYDAREIAANFRKAAAWPAGQNAATED